MECCIVVYGGKVVERVVELGITVSINRPRRRKV